MHERADIANEEARKNNYRPGLYLGGISLGLTLAGNIEEYLKLPAEATFRTAGAVAIGSLVSLAAARVINR